MLINSIILFLRDALPAFILISVLLAFANQQQRSLMWLGWGTALGFFSAVMLATLVDNLSELAEGAGMELTMILLQCLAYGMILLNLACSVGRQHNARLWQLTAAGAVLLTLTLDGANFLVFFVGFWTHGTSPLALMLGTMMGAAVCISVAVLLYLLCQHWLAGHRVWLCALFLLCWSAGQLVHILPLLAQVDLISPLQAVWDTSQWIADSSEMGHLLHSLFGYEAAPSFWQLVIYLLSALGPFAWLYLSKRQDNAAHLLGEDL
ncbi:FTR1 family protein [Bowmanella dokdonensis]|uniref:FTR1 family iron permease n=1 Tax=Bowmanella dokdonensis TaxID=751969 RepID=A0A939DS07_9ALTE|nr:hypothetical protein [Bowmanella dokdonensis]MBN7826841.1 hypothetical protein [Bowmanella dokdonensis]